MLTLFTIPKASLGEFAVIQRNAIHSWAHLRPSCEILLLGNEIGTEQLAAELGALHIPDIDCNEFGTPLVSSVVAQAEKHSTNSVLCYVNADIVLFSDFLVAVEEAIRKYPRSLLVGQRTNVPVPEPLDFSGNWERDLREKASREGHLEHYDGLDYFVFPRGFMGEIPAFAIGRTMWDQWFIYRTRSRGLPVVDCSRRLRVIHQTHSYVHHPGGKDGVWKGAEALKNLELAGGLGHAYTLRDATHAMDGNGITLRLVPYDLKRCFILPISTSRLLRPLISKAKSALRVVRS